LVTLDNVLKRGEHLDEMIEKSNELSLVTKQFYKKVKLYINIHRILKLFSILG